MSDDQFRAPDASPAEPNDGQDSPELPAAAPWFSNPPPLWLLLLTAVFSVMVVYSHSFPLGLRYPNPLGACSVWPVCLVIIAADYCARLVRLIARRRRKTQVWRWLCTPVLITTAFSARATDWPLLVRFERSLPAFEVAATQLLRGPVTASESLEDMREGMGFPVFVPYRQRIGSYDIKSVSVFPQERVVFFMTGGFFRGGWGFVYDPLGRDPEVRDICCIRRLAPGWSAFSFAKP